LFHGLKTGQLVVSAFALLIIILQFLYVSHFANLFYVICPLAIFDFRWRGSCISSLGQGTWTAIGLFLPWCLSLNNSESCQFIALNHKIASFEVLSWCYAMQPAEWIREAYSSCILHHDDSFRVQHPVS
jgi:hypothetical protein